MDEIEYLRNKTDEAKDGKQNDYSKARSVSLLYCFHSPDCLLHENLHVLLDSGFEGHFVRIRSACNPLFIHLQIRENILPHP